MKIAQIAPPWITVPPEGYGGTEWVVKHLCDGLTANGHDVTLFATGDSRTPAKLRSIFPREMPTRIGNTAFDARHVSFALDEIDAAGDFDLIHDHSGFLVLAFSRCVTKPLIHTCHGSFDGTSYGFYEQFADAAAFVSISDYQRSMAPPGMNWAGTAYNALPVDGWPFSTEKDDYLLAFGRICEDKGFHVAIDVAKRTGNKLIMAGVVQDWYREYFETQIVPHIDGEQIVYAGEVSDDEKRARLARAKGFLFPILWPEPFGLVMIEAMAAGTPVVALRNGSVDEVMEHGRTGFVVDDVDQMVAAVGRLGEIDAHTCRRSVEERFSVARMTASYEALYAKLLG
jgi:glycosyltransferase involved in cell wall biosynthesis